MSEPTARIETARLHALDLLDSAPRATLVIEARGHVRAVSLAPGASIVVGRGDEADVRIDDASLSRAHARFSLGPRGVEIEDLGSTNGTRVGGVAVDRRALAPGDTAQLGEAHVVVLGAHGLPWLIGHEALRARAHDERQRARLFARPFAVAVIRTPSGAARTLFDALVALRPVDRCALFGERDVEVLLPEARADEATDVIGKVLAAHPNAQAAFAVFGEDAVEVDALYDAARAALADAGVVARASRRTAAPADFTTRAPAMQAVLAQAERVAKTNVPILLLGETGAGKEVLARLIHARAGRKGPLVPINCGAIPLTLVESTLFGVVKGAFTGASADQAGAFESAHGGTVFLDEVGELPAAAQAALLRVLETRSVVRVGSTQEIAVDVRIVAATHRDLDAMVKAGAFRQDLLFRLNTMTLAVPPLRERREDIGPLADKLLVDCAAAQRRAVHGFTEDARELLERHTWPGNVRELKNAIERAVVFAGDRIDVDDLPPSIGSLGSSLGASHAAPPADATARASATAEPRSLAEQVDALERTLIVDALTRAHGSVTEAAALLQLPKRTLQYKMKSLGVARKVGYGAS